MKVEFNYLTNKTREKEIIPSQVFLLKEYQINIKREKANKRQNGKNSYNKAKNSYNRLKLSQENLNDYVQ